MSPAELESSLALPVNMDEELISKTVLQTNRAPLVLAFAVELLRYTMPEQPPSSRLSLAQAVVSANSRSKAVSLGIEKGAAAEDEGWGTGQPKVRIMGRDVAVLKRGGYEWKGEEEIGSVDAPSQSTATPAGSSSAPTIQAQTQPQNPTQTTITSYLNPSTASTVQLSPTNMPQWSTSTPLHLKKSTFLAHACSLPSHSSSASTLLSGLLNANPNLRSATHNAWAYRSTHPNTGAVSESSYDDGETGAGNLLLRIMRELEATNTFVVLTRWYGGIMLGPDRWRLMRNVVLQALSERGRKTGNEVVVDGEAVWGLDLEGMRSKSNSYGGGVGRERDMTSVIGTSIHAPQAARAYLLKSFASAPVTSSEEESPTKKKPTPKKSMKVLDEEKEENLGLLLGALRLLYDSWADHLTPAELDRRAWSWYIAVRPEVDSGPAGWGAKGVLKLGDILNLRRKE
jgi:hypothetical protein